MSKFFSKVDSFYGRGEFVTWLISEDDVVEAFVSLGIFVDGDYEYG